MSKGFSRKYAIFSGGELKHCELYWPAAWRTFIYVACHGPPFFTWSCYNDLVFCQEILCRRCIHQNREADIVPKMNHLNACTQIWCIAYVALPPPPPWSAGRYFSKTASGNMELYGGLHRKWNHAIAVSGWTRWWMSCMSRGKAISSLFPVQMVCIGQNGYSHVTWYNKHGVLLHRIEHNLMFKK